MKQNFANSMILPPKNGGLKAWSHSVRKANYLLFKTKCKQTHPHNIMRTKDAQNGLDFPFNLGYDF